MKNLFSSLLFLLLLCGLGGAASAQMNNRPYAFKTITGGVGMSMGGKQAILNQKIYGVSPENMVRAPDGVLLDVQKGPGGAAIVSTEGGGFIPSYRGTSFRGNNTDMAVGVFNSYFTPGVSDSGGGGSAYAHAHAGAVISTWTARVTSGGQPVSYLPGNTVDTWTGMVYTPY